MKNAALASLFAFALALLFVTPLIAHHSMSMYDLDHVITLRGTIAGFEWSNPHAQIRFDRQDDQGSLEKWTAECPSPGRLSRSGWTTETLKPGDQVTLIGNQAKDGSNLMRLDRIVLPDGHELRGYLR